MGIRKGTICVVYNAVETHKGGKLPEAITELPIPIVVSVGRLVPWKGMRELIDAIASVRAAGTPVSLVIVGDGPEHAELEKHAQETLKEGYVMTGRLAPEDTQAVIAHGDIFVLNTGYEGLSHTLIEAAQAGRAILTTRVGGNAEVVQDGKDGMLVPYGDQQALVKALRKLADDPELCERLGSEAQSGAERFSVPAMIEETRKILLTL